MKISNPFLSKNSTQQNFFIYTNKKKKINQSPETAAIIPKNVFTNI
jgi:hypothetical protein